MPKVQPLSPQLPKTPVTFSSSLPQSQPCCRSQQSFTTQIDASTTIFPFRSHSHSLPYFFPFPLTNTVATNVCQRTNKPSYIIPSPLISLSIHFASTTNFLLPLLSFTYNSSTFADITQSAINIPA